MGRLAGWLPLTGSFGPWSRVSADEVERWKHMGEPGQLIAGIVAGFTPEEVAKKRGWTTLELWRYELVIEEYLVDWTRRGKHRWAPVPVKQ